MGSDSVSKKFGIGFGIVRIWYQKKIVSDSVSKKFGIGKSFGFGFVQILGVLGDVPVSKLFHFINCFRFG